MGSNHRYPIDARLTHDAYMRIHSADSEWIGTPDYMGLAYFWAYAYRYPMRETTAAQRCRVHDAWLAAGLTLDAESDEHERLMWAAIGTRGRRSIESRFTAA